MKKKVKKIKKRTKNKGKYEELIILESDSD